MPAFQNTTFTETQFGSDPNYCTYVSLRPLAMDPATVELRFETTFTKAKDPSSRQIRGQHFMSRDDLRVLRDQINELLSDDESSQSQPLTRRGKGHEVLLQQWTRSNIAGDEWRWEVYATLEADEWSINARQIDEITGQVYRIEDRSRLKSARGIRARIERVFQNEHIHFDDVQIDWDGIVESVGKVSAAMAAALRAELERAEQLEQELLNPKQTAAGRYQATIDQWISQTTWPLSDAQGAGGIPRAVENHRRTRAMVQYVDAYFKEHASFPTGNHHIDILLEDLRHSVPGADGILKAMKAPGRIVLRVVFPTD